MGVWTPASTPLTKGGDSARRHEDGTVRFWDASGVCLRLLYKLSTVPVFLTDAEPSEGLSSQAEDEWPPLRKVRPRAWGWGRGVGWPRGHSQAPFPIRWAPLTLTVTTPGWVSRRFSSASTVAIWLWQAQQDR